MKEKLQRFMASRYGADDFSKFLLYASIVLLLISIIFRNRFFDLLVVALLLYSNYRALSKNHAKRFAENQLYLQLKSRFTGQLQRQKGMLLMRKDYHIYACPQCKQKIRMPKGKGKVVITCPKCRAEFTKRS